MVIRWPLSLFLMEEKPLERCVRLAAKYDGDPLDGTLMELLQEMGLLNWPIYTSNSSNTPLIAKHLPNIDQLVLAIQFATRCIVDDEPQTFVNRFDWVPVPDTQLRPKYFFVTQTGQPIALGIAFDRLSGALQGLLVALSALYIDVSPSLQHHLAHSEKLLSFAVDVLRCLIQLNRADHVAIH